MNMRTPHGGAYGLQPRLTLLGRLNSSWHERALRAFMVIVLAHWAEHLLQALQIYALAWSTHEAHGAVGLLFPWLVKSEVLHYTYAIVMLVGLCVLRRGFAGTEDRRWWTIAIWIQGFHHLEHALLLSQIVVGQNLFDRPVPTSLVQLWVPRVELHLFYNTIVFIPMVIAIYHHLFPSFSNGRLATCTCARRRGIASVTGPEEDRSLSRRAWRRLPSHTAARSR
jgi:hypothetical protein